MIDLNKLRAVKRIVTHVNCADGLVSALLCKDAFPEATVEFVQYTTEAHVNLAVTPNMLFADMSPPAERVQEFVAAGALVLDHHRTARAVVDAFGDDGIFGDENTQPGVCGATLCYEHVWKAIAAPRHTPSTGDFVAQFARLAGVLDTWQRKDTQWHEAGIQHSTLMFFPSTFWMSKPLVDIAANWPQYRWIGEIQVQKNEDRVSKATVEALRFKTAAGTRVVCFEGVRLTSDAAERLDKEVDLVIGFSYRNDGGETPRLILSTRSHTTFDCAAFARANGGGGHTKAAGCSFPVEIETEVNPYLRVRRLIEDFEAKSSGV
jgi:hypothetical protein